MKIQNSNMYGKFKPNYNVLYNRYTIVDGVVINLGYSVKDVSSLYPQIMKGGK